MRRLTVLAVALALPVLAALPPRSPQELQADADYVIDGQVRSVREQKLSGAGRFSLRYQVDFAVLHTRKGRLAPGPITVWLRQAGPGNPPGPQGQNEIPPQGKKVRFYLTRQGDHYEALEPNGWSPL